MNEEQLLEAERIARAAVEDVTCDCNKTWTTLTRDIPMLCAEVRRLRAAIKKHRDGIMDPGANHKDFKRCDDALHASLEEE